MAVKAQNERRGFCRRRRDEFPALAALTPRHPHDGETQPEQKYGGGLRNLWRRNILDIPLDSAGQDSGRIHDRAIPYLEVHIRGEVVSIEGRRADIRHHCSESSTRKIEENVF